MPAEPTRFQKLENQQKTKRPTPVRQTPQSAFRQIVQPGALTQGFRQMTLNPATTGPVGPTANTPFAFADALVANAPAPALSATDPMENTTAFKPVVRANSTGGKKTKRRKRKRPRTRRN